jgi:predicted regulator of Ras-like GTPase activity (Roadblock/LC7/MglB family)
MFRESLHKMIDRLDPIGGAAGLLMGFDGIAVESYVRPGVADMPTVSAELAHLIAQIRRALRGAGIGGLTEVTLRTEKLAVLIEIVTESYFLALGLLPNANLGKARYLLRLLGPQIRPQL